jgi:integrase
MKVMFRSRFARYLTDYIDLRRRLGFKLESQAAVLRRLDTYVHRRRYRGQLTQAFVLAFATASSTVSRTECWRRYQFVRHFTEYLSAFDPTTPRLDPKALRNVNERPPVHVYTEIEIGRLLREARGVSPKHPVRGVTLHAMIGLAASTGLRIGEVVRLDNGDVDLERGVLTIRRTKFKKDRLVPIHPTVATMLRGYVIEREAACRRSRSPAFFVSMRSGRFARNTIEGAFKVVAVRAGLRRPTGKGPSFHGLRHRFAVRRLIAWYEDGVDVQGMLPTLATYLGHARYSDTAYYLNATSELLAVAAARYHRSLSRRAAKA